jgi:hypothetical protein
MALGLLQLDHLAELVWLGGLALADELARRLEQAEKLPFDMRVAAKHGRPSPLHHLPYPRRHLFDLLTQAFEGELFDDAARPFDPRRRSRRDDGFVVEQPIGVASTLRAGLPAAASSGRSNS